MSEALLMAGLYGTGYLFASGTGVVTAVGAAAVALPLGAALFSAGGVALLAARLPFSAGAALAVAAAAAVAFVVARRASEVVGVRRLAGLVVGVALVAGASLALQEVNVSRLTPDSYDHLAVGSFLAERGSAASIPDITLAKRSVVLGFLYSGAGDELVRPSATPLLSAGGVAGFVWLAWAALARLGVGRRRALLTVGAATLLAVGTQHVTWQSTYVNIHFLMASCTLLLAVSLWTHVSSGDRGWLALALPPLALVAVARAEGPLLAALFLVPVMAHGGTPRRTRWTLAAACVALAGAWHLGVLTPALADGVTDTVVLSGLAVAFATTALAVLGEWDGGLGRLVRFAPALMLAALVALLVAFGAQQSGVMRESVAAALRNTFLTGGHWGLTWWALPAALALTLPRVPLAFASFWRVSLVGFGLLWLALPILRESAYREGLGDSGNRVLLHILFAALFAAVVAMGAHTTAPRQEPA